MDSRPGMRGIRYQSCDAGYPLQKGDELRREKRVEDLLRRLPCNLCRLGFYHSIPGNKFEIESPLELLSLRGCNHARIDQVF